MNARQIELTISGRFQSAARPKEKGMFNEHTFFMYPNRYAGYLRQNADSR